MQYSLGEDIGATIRAVLNERLLRKDVRITTLTRPLEIVDDGVQVANVLTDARSLIPADTVIFSSGGRPRDILYRQLHASVGTTDRPGLHVIGDAVAPRHLRHAITHGARVAREIR